MLVCGLGHSLLDVPRNPPIASIGVNDVWQWVETDYVLVLGDPEVHFDAKRRASINASRPMTWFMEKGGEKAWKAYWKGFSGLLDPDLHQIVTVPFNFPQEKPRKGRIYQIPETSPATAIGIALFMGATRIGLVGVDLISAPSLAEETKAINDKFAQMNKVAKVYGSKIYNLSPRSALTCYPEISFQEFLDHDEILPRQAKEDRQPS